MWDEDSFYEHLKNVEEFNESKWRRVYKSLIEKHLTEEGRIIENEKNLIGEYDLIDEEKEEDEEVTLIEEKPHLTKEQRIKEMNEKLLKFTNSLEALRQMNIPICYTEEVVQKIEKQLRNHFWVPTMELIRKLEHARRYPDMSFYAPKLRESEEMEYLWRSARIQKMNDNNYWERREKREERERIEALKEQELPTLVDHIEPGELVEDLKLEIPKYQPPIYKLVDGNWRICKKKKKHRKRKRPAHYSRCSPTLQ